MVEGRSLTSDWLLGIGVLFTVPWGVWVFVEIMTVYARFGDKQYMLVTRKQLSKEYQY